MQKIRSRTFERDSFLAKPSDLLFPLPKKEKKRGLVPFPFSQTHRTKLEFLFPSIHDASRKKPSFYFSSQRDSNEEAFRSKDVRLRTP